eukprot:5855437-Prymnesium_polylepis.2
MAMPRPPARPLHPIIRANRSEDRTDPLTEPIPYLRAMHAHKPRVIWTHAMRRARHTLSVISHATGHATGMKR